MVPITVGPNKVSGDKTGSFTDVKAGVMEADRLERESQYLVALWS